MKIIQAMKKLKDLNQKAEDLRAKVAAHSADVSVENPVYENQKGKIQEWIQAHGDILKEILSLRVRIQKTNLATSVTIELDGRSVTKTIAEWIHRRRELAGLERDIWAKLTDRGLKEGQIQTTPNGPITKVEIRRYYDPEIRDQKVALYRSEPGIIDGVLEVVNATTDLLD